MIYGSVCSGIEAATVAWDSLGWKPAFFSEIEKFPREVLSHHYPDVPLHGDFTTIGENDYDSIELLVGGTPCQSFSVAGLRKGLDDDRGNLALEYLKLAQRKSPTWLVWENVPGVLSSNGGRDFGAFLGGLVECGYGFAYRVLDAQYFGVPQRRRRVFVVGYLGDWRPAAAVLFERECLSGNPPPRRAKRQDVTETAGTHTANCGGLNRPAGNANELDFCVVNNNQDRLHTFDYTAGTICSRDYKGVSSDDLEQAKLIIHESQSTQEPIALVGNNLDVAPCLDAQGSKAGSNQWVDTGQYVLCMRDGQAHVVHGTQDKEVYSLPGNWIGRKPENGGNQVEPFINESPCLTSTDRHAVANNMQVRRLTPIECERLQGFPDGYTDIKKDKTPDEPRYKALGNSMAVPVMHWIGQRIEEVQKIMEQG